MLPGTLPSIFTGAAVGMGITWEVVLAARDDFWRWNTGWWRPRLFHLEFIHGRFVRTNRRGNDIDWHSWVYLLQYHP